MMSLKGSLPASSMKMTRAVKMMMVVAGAALLMMFNAGGREESYTKHDRVTIRERVRLLQGECC